MKKCLNCGHNFEPLKPKAIYCSDACRTESYRKKHKKEGAKRGRPRSIFDGPKLPKNIQDEPKQWVDPKPPEQKINPVFNNQDILKQISAIKEEKIPKERDTIFGRKMWNYDQQKRVKELENKLK